MRIVYHHRTRSTDGQRIHIQEMVRAFEQLGHQVRLVSLVPTDAEQNNARRDAGEALWKRLVRRVPFAYELVQLGYNLIGLPMLLKAVLAGRTDFIYERYSLFNFTGVLAARACGVPIILEVNSPFALEQARDKDIRARRLAHWSERIICNLATHVIVVSSPLARILAEQGIRESLITVMPNGVSDEHLRARCASPELRRRLGLDNCLVAGFVGWFRKWHGLELLLEAYLRSGLASSGVKLLLIGDGPAMPELKAFVEQHGLEGQVVFSGPVPHAEVPEYLHLIDIAVQPAANEYCCPMKILEYMAMGKPVVAPRQENILELLREGEEAVYFDPGDVRGLAAALAALANNPGRMARMGAAARQAILERGLLWTGNAGRVLDMATPGGRESRVPDGKLTPTPR
jgi:glycosyltransferase involved in cell wall biosynthesis